MSFRCPDCKRDDALYVEVEVPGWNSVDANLDWLDGANHHGVEWSDAYEMGAYGCGECEWHGPKSGLEELGIDGEPLPDVHRDQISIEESLMELSEEV